LVVHLVLTLSSIDDGDDDGTIPLSPSTVMDWFSFLSLSDPLSLPGYVVDRYGWFCDGCCCRQSKYVDILSLSLSRVNCRWI
jgi:hypothetical protein